MPCIIDVESLNVMSRLQLFLLLWTNPYLDNCFNTNTLHHICRICNVYIKNKHPNLCPKQTPEAK